METSGIDLNFSETTDQGNFVDRYSRNLNSSRLNEEEVLLQVLSFTGYALVAPCVIVLLSAIFHPVHDHLFFYLLWLFIGGLTAARLATAFASRAEDSTHRVTLMAVSASLHMLFMLYLHFAYHSTAEQINSIAIQIQ
ncbi:protein YIPF3-like isoform X2 [Symsagittifera roscoffensis]|uniref:protein YIPF3-like isoform X2 n=1 Tax=Symsagittifera roscoffensis TaxID=84072 RepID=UPI00307C3956